MRLDKYISYALNLTRSKSRALIRKGQIKVNNEVVSKADLQIIENEDIIIYDDIILDYQKYIYLMVNKPRGYISSRHDEDYPSVLNLVFGYEKYNLVIAGRLDLDSEGFLLLTNDGQLVHSLTSPNFNCPKKYYVLVDKPFLNSDILIFQKGLMIKDGKGEEFLTKPAHLEIISDNDAYLTIYEGKFHQVRRMCQAIGKEVKKLIRVKIGDLNLDRNLKPGEYRALDTKEVEILKKHSHN